MDVPKKGNKPNGKSTDLPKNILKQIEKNERELQGKLSKIMDSKQKLNLTLTSDKAGIDKRTKLFRHFIQANKPEQVHCTEHVEDSPLLNNCTSGKIVQFDNNQEIAIWSEYVRAKETSSVSVTGHIQQKVFDMYKDFALKESRAFAKKVPNGAIVQQEDCESASYIGLIHAIQAYDPSCGVKFQVFARMRIRGAMIDQLRVMQNFPRSISKALRERRPIISKLRQRLHKEPTPEEIEDYCLQHGLNELMEKLRDPLIHSGVYNESNNYRNSNGGGDGGDCDSELEEALYANAVDYRGSISNSSSRTAYFIELVQSVISTEEKWLIVFGYYFMKMTNKAISFALKLSISSIVVKRRKAIEELRNKLRNMKSDLLKEVD